VLPYGSPAKVQAAVRQCVRDIAPEKSGLLIGPSHRMMTDIPLSNVEALLAAFRAL
jgi:uroporphyrinogen-III decarboxylase